MQMRNPLHLNKKYFFTPRLFIFVLFCFVHDLRGKGLYTDCATVMLRHTPGGSSVFGSVVFYRMTHSLMDRRIDILTLATGVSLTGGAVVMEEDCK